VEEEILEGMEMVWLEKESSGWRRCCKMTSQMISNACSDSFLDWITASTQWQRYFKVGVHVHPMDEGAEKK
jgi:hypothetical protein